MFILSTLEDDVRVQPEDLHKPPIEAVSEVLKSTFVGKVVYDLGLIVTIYEVSSIEGGFVYPNDGCAFFKATFQAVVLRPFVGEVMVGRLVGSDKSGVKISLGFFDDVHIPENLLQNPSFFEDSSKEWFWEFDENRLPMEINEEVRFRVYQVKFNPEPTPAQLRNAQGDDQLLGTAAKPFAPMEIVGEIDGDGLGMAAWWQEAAEGMEQ